MSTPSSPVVYVALGTRRIRAARALAAELAATGRPVLLVVAGHEGWADYEAAAGVTLRKLEVTQPTHALRAARKELFGRRGPLAGAGLLIVGDCEAMPIADAARRRFPRLEVRTDVSADPERLPAAADVAVVTPWYPSPNDPFAGAFVQAATAAAGPEAGSIVTLHTENWFYSPKGVTGKLIGVTTERELARHGGVSVHDTPEGELARVVVPQLTNGNHASWGQAQVERMRAALPTGRIEAPVVHAHTGHYAGVVAAELARDDAKLVITEHATFLSAVFNQPASRRAYDAMLSRADTMLCVGQALYDQIVERFPQHQHKLRIVPNPVDFDRFAVRPEAPAAPLRWLYVGRMLEHKGVHTLLEAFATVAAEDPRVTLTLVGSGALEGTLRKRIAELGLGDRVTQRPPVRPEEVAGLMHEHDVLTHASTSETFGMTLIEAIATETPVLAARSKGPAETLQGLDHVAGQLFEVTDDPEQIVTAYRKLVDGWDGLDLPEARRQLRERYGREAVGARLREIYREVLTAPETATEDTPAAEMPPAPEPDADRIAIVAISPPGARNTRQFIKEVRRQGYAVDLIGLDAAHWQGPTSDPGVTFHAIGKVENRRLTRRLERVVVTSFPRRALGFLRARAKALPSPMPEALAITAQRGHKVVADQFNRKVYDPYYSVVRPRILWRIARRRVVPNLDLEHTRRVVVHGLPGITIGWGLARKNPSISVGTDLTVPEPARAGETTH